MSGFSRRTHNAIIGFSPVYRVWPATTGVPAVGTVCVSAAGAWGAAADIVAAAAILTDFWACGICLDTFAGGAIQVLEIQITNATLAAVIGEFRFDPSLVTVNVGPFMFPYPVHLAGSTQVTGRLGGAAIRTVNISLIYALNL